MKLPNERIEAWTEELKKNAAALDANLAAGNEVCAKSAIKVYGKLAELLSVQKKIHQAEQVVTTLDDYLEKRLGAIHPDTLRAKSLKAHIHLGMGNHSEALALLDSVCQGWENHNDYDGAASARLTLIEHYMATRQPKLAWEAFRMNIQTFDKSFLSGTTHFIATILELSRQLGKENTAMILDNWLALAEDSEWEPDQQKQMQYQIHLDEYRHSVGGLLGLLGI